MYMPSNIVKSFADKTGKSEAEVEKLWDKAKGITTKQYPDVKESDDNFYALTTGILKRMLRVEESLMFTEESIISDSIMFAEDMIQKETILDSMPQSESKKVYLKKSEIFFDRIGVKDWSEAYVKEKEFSEVYKEILNDLVRK